MYRRPLPLNWWLKNRRYFLFMVREFTALPISLWLISLLMEISRVGRGPTGTNAGYYPYTSPAFVVFSLICFVFAVYHSVTWLAISGLILRVPMGERDLPPGLVTGANYVLWVVATIVIGGLLIVLGG
jgi:fumarate reductase subunit C